MKRILILAVFIATHTFSILPVRAVKARNDSLEAIASDAAPVDEAVAEAVAAAAITPGIELPDTYGLLVRTLLSLFAVVALIWGAVQLMKRLSPESTGGKRGADPRSRKSLSGTQKGRLRRSDRRQSACARRHRPGCHEPHGTGSRGNAECVSKVIRISLGRIRLRFQKRQSPI